MRLNWKIIPLSASLFGSFFITLWLIEQPKSVQAPPVFRPEALKTIVASSNADVLQKLSTSGLRADEGIMGRIDEFASQPDRAVRVVGWALDQSHSGTPLTIYIYVNGDPRLTIKTAGPRDDVAKEFNLPESVAKNMAFSGTFTCEATAQAMVLAIDPAGGGYAQLDQRSCPYKLF